MLFSISLILSLILLFSLSIVYPTISLSKIKCAVVSLPYIFSSSNKLSKIAHFSLLIERLIASLFRAVQQQTFITRLILSLQYEKLKMSDFCKIPHFARLMIRRSFKCKGAMYGLFKMQWLCDDAIKYGAGF